MDDNVIYLTAEQEYALNKIAEQLGRTVWDLAGAAIDESINNWERAHGAIK